MKAITEFPEFILSKALELKTSLIAEGKTPEEAQASLGEKYKFEGDKLNHFVRAIDVVAQKLENVRRVLVVTLNEGESAPARATKVDDFYYIPDIPTFTGSKPGEKPKPKERGGKGKGRGPKESPWGLSPEEKAAKNAKKPAGDSGKPS